MQEIQLKKHALYLLRLELSDLIPYSRHVSEVMIEKWIKVLELHIFFQLVSPHKS